MAKMILIGEVAYLAKDIEARHGIYPGALLEDNEKAVQFRDLVMADSGTEYSPVPEGHKTLSARKSSNSPTREHVSPNDSYAAPSVAETEKLAAMHDSTSENVQMLNLLDEW